MTWQDELQQLDAELTAGRISADEYRQRRDAVLGRAQAEQSDSPSGGFPAQQPDPGEQHSWPRHSVDPGQSPGGYGGQPGPQQNPFPPAFSWQQYGGDPEGRSDSTQVVRNTGAQPPGGQQDHQQQPPSPPHGWPSQGQYQQARPDEQFQWGQYSWGAGSGGSGTPWGNSEFTPEHGDQSWLRQGPEVFETVGGPAKKGKTVGLYIGGLLAIGVAVAVVFYFLSSQAPPQANPPQETSSSPTSTTPPLPEPPAAKAAPENAAEVLIPPPDGKPHPFNGPLGRKALSGQHSGALITPVREFALNNGMIDGRYSGTDAEGVPVRTTMIAVKMPDEGAADGLTQRYLTQQEGLKIIDELSYQGVEVYSAGDTLRTAYTSHSWTVILDVQAVNASNSDARALFEKLLTDQLAKTPPTIRE